MHKFRVSTLVVNRGGKKFFAKDGVIEVSSEDAKHFEGFEEIKTAKKTKDEDNK